MKLIRALAGVLALACATLAHAATVVVPASAVHLCVNVHDQDAPQVVTSMRAAGFTCYRKDATGGAIENTLAATGFTGDFIVTDGPGPTQQMALVAKLAHAFPGSVGSVESRNEVNNRATSYGGFTDTTGGDQSKRQAIVLYDAALEATVNSLLPGVPVLAHTDIHATYGATDFANAHAYDGVWLRAVANLSGATYTDVEGAAHASGTVQFYYAQDNGSGSPSTWSAMGVAQPGSTAGMGQIGTASAPFQVLPEIGGIGFAGDAFKAVVYDAGATAGTQKVLVNVDFTAQATTTTVATSGDTPTFADNAPTPNTFTVSGPAFIS